MNAVMMLFVVFALIAIGAGIAAGYGVHVAWLALLAVGLFIGLALGLWLRPEFDGKDDVG